MPAIAHSVGTVSSFDAGGRLRTTDARLLKMLREMLREMLTLHLLYGHIPG
jgi:hypothetical protein